MTAMRDELRKIFESYGERGELVQSYDRARGLGVVH
jgi:hypothetical protein